MNMVKLGTRKIVRCDHIKEMVLGRRQFVTVAGASGVSLLLAGCGNDGLEFVPATPTSTAIPKIKPVSTQGPISSPVAGYGDPQKWIGRTLTVAGWGGDYPVVGIYGN